MLRTLLLTLSSLLAMARHRPWEPLLIMAAIILANAGLVTVLLINEGATQGELLQSKQGLTLGSIITPADSRARFTQSDYATLHKQGFTQLVVLLVSAIKGVIGPGLKPAVKNISSKSSSI